MYTVYNNKTISKRKNNRKDEYYTKYGDIKKEVESYYSYDNNVFRDKVVLLPCDDSSKSNIFKYFDNNFLRFGLKKLIATSYAYRHMEDIDVTDLMVRDTNNLKESDFQGNYAIIENINGKKEYISNKLRGDGDFRSEEVTEFKDEADIIITNPPFSLLREMIEWIDPSKKKFIILGPYTAIQYKNFSNYIINGEIWIGATHLSWFYREDGSEFRIDNCCWYTNMKMKRTYRNAIELHTIEYNLKNNKPLRDVLINKYGEDKDNLHYLKYANSEAIEVPMCEAIPSDYTGIMGVPLTFMMKEQYYTEYELVGMRFGNDGKDLVLNINGEVFKPYTRLIVKRKDMV